MYRLNDIADPDDLGDEYQEELPRKSRFKINLAIFLIITTALSGTLAANISLSGGRKEFGQGIFQIKACDQWIGIGLTAGSGVENPYVKNLKMYGFDPRLCIGRIFNIKLFPEGSTTPLNLYIDEGATSGSTETATQLSLMDTSTTFSGSYSGPGGTGYAGWAADAVTLVNKQGANVGWYSDYLSIDYDSNKGIYTVIFAQPRALVAQVATVTIESAKYS